MNHSCQLPSKVQWSRQLMLKKRKRRQSRQLMLKKNKVSHLPSPSRIPLSNPHIWLFSKSYRFNCFTFRSKTSSGSLFCVLLLYSSYLTLYYFLYWPHMNKSMLSCQVHFLKCSLTGQSPTCWLSMPPPTYRIWSKLISLAPKALCHVFPNCALCPSQTTLHCLMLFYWSGRQLLTP